MAGLRRRLGIPGGTQVLSADRHTQLWIKSECDQVELPAGLFKQQLLQVRSNSHALFQGKNVIVTMSRNNELAWIGDWVRFHVETHGCNAVLLYDNASTNCRGAEIKDQIVSVRGIDAALVVDWPFKLGPGGGPHWVWDSDFGQYGMLEHARHRYLPTASAVLNVDIDELVLTTAGSSIFDLARRSDVGYVRFAGRWVENATSLMLNPPARRHKHYFYYRDGPTALPKWAVVPARCPPHAQWRVHDIAAMQPDVVASAAATLRHFKAINTNWKDERWKPEALDPAHHRIDEALVAALRIFEDGPTGARRGQIT